MYVRPRLDGYGTFDFDSADYFVEAWYLVGGDIDIFNSMGWVQVDPQLVR